MRDRVILLLIKIENWIVAPAVYIVNLCDIHDSNYWPGM